MTTLNSVEEVLLAERLISMHPWAHNVKFARTGGEANAIALRIARAATGKPKVAFCGYHGWHDWYLSANLVSKDSLDSHLLPGLQPLGVPGVLKGTAYPFQYNDLAGLAEVLDADNEIGIVFMEVERNLVPQPGFLEGVREITSRRGLVLIFDECTSGFRETFGGLHLKYGVSPDIATFGKALGNGYAISAAIGREQVMDAAQGTFISSTFWSDRIGPAAALATLDEMEELQAWKTLPKVGRKMKEIWSDTADQQKVELEVKGLSALPSFEFTSRQTLDYQTFLSQEMLRAGFLAWTAFYPSIEHESAPWDDFTQSLSEVFYGISAAERDPSIRLPIVGPSATLGFTRLN
jgi:glutamate-1-semialdehyde 2,1-aminomutase